MRFLRFERAVRPVDVRVVPVEPEGTWPGIDREGVSVGSVRWFWCEGTHRVGCDRPVGGHWHQLEVLEVLHVGEGGSGLTQLTCRMDTGVVVHKGIYGDGSGIWRHLPVVAPPMFDDVPGPVV